MFSKTLRNRFADALILFLTAVCSTHCTYAGLNSKDSASQEVKASGNGTSYDGKMRYVARSAEANVCADGAATKTVVEIDDQGAAWMTRKNCADVKPIAIDFGSLNLMGHNLSNAILDGHVLDQDRPELQFTSRLCRGSQQREFIEGKYMVVADTVIRPAKVANSVQPFTAQLKIGYYDKDRNSVATPIAMVDVELRYYRSGTGVYDVYVATVWQDGKKWRVKVFVKTDGQTGVMEFSPADAGNLQAPVATLPSIQAPPAQRIAITCYPGS